MTQHRPVPMSGTTNTLLWVPEYEIEAQSLDQIRGVSRLAPVMAQRIMPDVHWGNGASVGTVIGMRDAISPACVGVDIGCGVSAKPTGLNVETCDLSGPYRTNLLHEIKEKVEEYIPVGFNAHEKPVSLRYASDLSVRANDLWESFGGLWAPLQHLQQRAALQLGTLGGGNHFIELCKDDEGDIWMTLHSGSRNIGHAIAQHHTKVAKQLPHNKGLGDLAYFKYGTPEYEQYISDLYWAQKYARLNRAIMMYLFSSAMINTFLGFNPFGEISCHHNYVAEESINGETLIVTRKGAISAHEGELGVIPGNMAEGSFIVRGLGNELSLFSAPHGAGRTMSRSKAKSLISHQDFLDQTEGIVARKDDGLIDEAPGAYKDFTGVINASADLVEVVTHLQTLMCVKG